MNIETLMELTIATLAGALVGGSLVMQAFKELCRKYDNLHDAAKALYDNVEAFATNETLTMRSIDFGLQLAPELVNLEQALAEDY